MRPGAARHSPSTAAASLAPGPPADTIPVPPKRPQALAAGPNGDLYLVHSARNQVLRLGASGEVRGGRERRPTGILRRRRIHGPCRTPSRGPGRGVVRPRHERNIQLTAPLQFRLPHDAARPSPHSPRQRTEPAHMRSPAGLHQPKRKQKIIGDLELFEPITMLRLSRYATAKSAVVYGLQGGRVSASACSAGPPWGDGGPTPPRRLAPSGSAIAKSEASVVPSGGSCTNSPGRPSAHSRCSSSRRAQCPHRPTPSRKAAHRESSASESSSARILVTDSWSFGRSRVTVFHTTSRSISK